MRPQQMTIAQSFIDRQLSYVLQCGKVMMLDMELDTLPSGGDQTPTDGLLDAILTVKLLATLALPIL